MSSTGDVELRSHGYRFAQALGNHRQRWWNWLEVQKQWIHAVCPSSTSGMKDSGMEENQRRTDSRDGPPGIVKMTMKDITFWHV